jgi:phage repressor protein C with HTH and peptisase S24 domain
VILLGELRLALVRGPSMVPTLRDGDRVLVRLGGGLRPGRVVLVELPGRPLSVKRLVAVEPGGQIRIEGDNEFGSTDSRTLGPQPAAAVRGVVLARVWPRPRRL